MRPLKFRLYFHDNELRKITYSTHAFKVTDKNLHIMLARFEENTIKGFVQFTGLKDRNGKEIYEGDVIMIDGNKKTLVSWSEKFASFCLKNDTWAFQHWFGEALDPSECEVIGNIYETPNLLK